MVSDDHIEFKSLTLGNVWTAVIPKGNQYKFNEAVWGATTRCYLEPIKALSDEHFTLIVEETQKYVKKSAMPVNSVDLEEDGSDYEELFAFR